MLVTTARRLGILFVVALAAALPIDSGAETRVGGRIAADSRWTRAESPYIVTEDVVVPVGVTLEIEPGVTVRFKANIADQSGVNAYDLELIVRGTLRGHGAEGDSLYFTSDSSDPTWMDWQGLVVIGEKALLELSAAHVSYANAGIRCEEGGTVNLRKVTLSACSYYGVHSVGGRGTLDDIYCTTIGNTGGTGIGVWMDRGSRMDIRNSYIVGVQNGVSYSRGSGGRLENTVITLCTGTGVIVRKSSPEVSRCTITGNEYGLSLSGQAAPVVRDNNIFENGTADLRLTEYGRTPMQVDVSGNWWGTAEVAVVEERILDALDNPKEKAVAVFEPILTEAATTGRR